MDKREKEMHTVYEMIHLYCRKNHKEKELNWFKSQGQISDSSC